MTIAGHLSRRWSHGTYYCYTSGQDCIRCDNYPILGDMCGMPKAIKTLQDEGIQPHTKLVMEYSKQVGLPACRASSPDLVGKKS